MFSDFCLKKYHRIKYKFFIAVIIKKKKIINFVIKNYNLIIIKRFQFFIIIATRDFSIQFEYKLIKK